MLKGETFDLQTFTSDAFALFIDRFANEQSGVMTGCELSNTSNSATIGEGYFLIRGRLLRIISNVTVSSITADGYYSLICEIDLSKTNTTTEFNQGEIKAISSSSGYPTLTQQDITDGGTVYQYEFARFRVSSGTITDFTDRRTYVNYGNILGLVSEALTNLENQSNVLLKSDFSLLTGTIITPEAGSETTSASVSLSYPDGYTRDNCIVIGLMSRNEGLTNKVWCTTGGMGNSTENMRGNYGLQAVLRDTGIDIFTSKINTSASSATISVKVVLMKLPNGNQATKLGDVNLDGEFTTTDYNMILGYDLGSVGLTFEQFANADMNKDGKVDSLDALKWQQEHQNN